MVLLLCRAKVVLIDAYELFQPLLCHCPPRARVCILFHKMHASTKFDVQPSAELKYIYKPIPDHTTDPMVSQQSPLYIDLP